MLFFIYSSAQKFFKLPFDENNFDSVFGANQKINIEKKIRLALIIIPTSPSDERISNTPIMLYLMRVGKMKPKTRIKKYKVVNILYILKTDFIAYLILCSESLHCNRVVVARFLIFCNKVFQKRQTKRTVQITTIYSHLLLTK